MTELVSGMKRATYRRLKRVLPWVVFATCLLAWEVGCLVFHVRPTVLPRPSLVVGALYQYFAIIMYQAGQTLFTTLIGFSIAVVVGLVMGMLIGSSELAYAGLYRLLVAFNTVPKVALIPVFVVWFGIGAVPAILTSFALAFFPIVVNVATGIASVEPEMRDVLRSLRAREDQILLKIGLPRTMPFFFGSLKIAITNAFVGSVTAETIASNNGIGYLMISASSQFNVALVFAGVAVVGILGVILYEIFDIAERRLTGWSRRSAG
jgi:NitT/TauT family transport system permease protein